jgi:translation initiation factor 1
MGKRPKDPPPPAAPPRFHAPFEGLRARLGVPEAPAGPEQTAAVADPAPAAPAGKPGPPRAVVRFERKGRGGKAVTVVEKLGLAPRELEAWLSDLKRALGCGGQVEADALVLQGDLRERVRPLLAARGVRKVTVA